MAISAQTRKFLWGGSGKRCAKCRQPLTANAAGADPAVILGEECHIVSGRPNGPRYRPLPPNELDAVDNLILLCPTDHALVDKQVYEFTEERLRAMKLEHEAWVDALPDAAPEIRIRLRPADGSAPVALHRVETGQRLMGFVGGAHDCEISRPEPRNREEAQLIAGFLKGLDDWALIWDELGMGEQIEPEFQLTEEITELLEAGFLIYCGLRAMVLEGGLGGPQPWQSCILNIFRIDDPQIQNQAASHAAAAGAQPTRPRLAPLGPESWRIGDVEERGGNIMRLAVLPVFCDLLNMGDAAAVLYDVSATGSVAFPEVDAPPTIPPGEKGTVRVDFRLLEQIRAGDSIELTVPYRGPDATIYEPLRVRGQYVPPGRWRITPLSSS